DYVVQEPNERIVKPKAYADNFAFGRRVPWSH
ncbi:MAG: oxidoreductase, partial [Alphaproteobacteria bacterium]